MMIDVIPAYLNAPSPIFSSDCGSINSSMFFPLGNPGLLGSFNPVASINHAGISFSPSGNTTILVPSGGLQATSVPFSFIAYHDSGEGSTHLAYSFLSAVMGVRKLNIFVNDASSYQLTNT